MIIVTFYSLHFFILILSLEIHFAMINNKNKLIITSIIAMTFLIGFTANEAYAGVDPLPCEDCSPNVEVDIDIKPGSDPNSINSKSMGLVPVAILSSDGFDATDVDVTTVTFGPGQAVPVHSGHLEDVNGDGLIDMVVHFVQKETGLFPGDTEAALNGATNDGLEFCGMDAVIVK